MNGKVIKMANYRTTEMPSFLGGSTAFLFPGKAFCEISTRALKL